MYIQWENQPIACKSTFEFLPFPVTDLLCHRITEASKWTQRRIYNRFRDKPRWKYLGKISVDELGWSFRASDLRNRYFSSIVPMTILLFLWQNYSGKKALYKFCLCRNFPDCFFQQGLGISWPNFQCAQSRAFIFLLRETNYFCNRTTFCHRIVTGLSLDPKRLLDLSFTYRKGLNRLPTHLLRKTTREISFRGTSDDIVTGFGHRIVIGSNVSRKPSALRTNHHRTSQKH